LNSAAILINVWQSSLSGGASITIKDVSRLNTRKYRRKLASNEANSIFW